MRAPFLRSSFHGTRSFKGRKQLTVLNHDNGRYGTIILRLVETSSSLIRLKTSSQGGHRTYQGKPGQLPMAGDKVTDLGGQPATATFLNQNNP